MTDFLISKLEKRPLLVVASLIFIAIASPVVTSIGAYYQSKHGTEKAILDAIAKLKNKQTELESTQKAHLNRIERNEQDIKEISATQLDIIRNKR